MGITMCKITEQFYKESNKFRQATRNGYIVFIDDDESMCELYRVIATRMGYAVRTFLRSDEAIKEINQNFNSIRCVVVDLHLDDDPKSVQGGFDVVNCIEEQHYSLPYVIHTGDPTAAAEIRKKYCRAVVVHKNGSMDDIIDALSLDAHEIRNAG